MTSSTEAEIKSRIGYYIRQEAALLTQLDNGSLLATRIRNPIGNDLIADGAKFVANEVIGLPSIGGRYAKKLTKLILREQQGIMAGPQGQMILAQHEAIVDEVRSFLNTISSMKPNLKTPNSSTLILGINNAQRFVRVRTKVSRTILALQNLMNMSLIYNHDIRADPQTKTEMKDPIIVDMRFPRLASLRNEIPELEPPLREFMRKSLIKEYGADLGN